MDTTIAVVKAQEMMVNGAKAFADKGETQFKAAMHQALCGRILSKLVAEGLEPSAKNMTVVFAAVQNHSAWRQKFEKDGVFTGKKEAKNDYAEFLEEEGV